ncbi:TPA: hypothetical protein I7759_05330 [Vibrio vulnificus]|nr:hypothetical protein [Vibrio vulnificus]
MVSKELLPLFYDFCGVKCMLNQVFIIAGVNAPLKWNKMLINSVQFSHRVKLQKSIRTLPIMLKAHD